MLESVLDDGRLALLKSLTALEALDRFYLAGGTALSLQLGLRVSVDFNFFTSRRFNADALCDALRARFPSTRTIVLEPDTCDLLIKDVRVSFFRYPYPLVEALVRGLGEFSNLCMANPVDIAAMKLSAIGSRGARKDFYDLYQIYHRVPGFDGDRLIAAVRAKFGRERDLTYMLMGLGCFDEAEREELAETFVPAGWDEIKRFFIAEQRRLFDKEEARARRAFNEAGMTGY